jgi:ribose 5-phosphate isomerase A
MTQDEQKVLVAQAAVQQVMDKISSNEIIGIGTGSTVNFFIEALSPFASHFQGVVSSSEASTRKLLEKGFRVLDANQVNQLATYVDGADEINPKGAMLKGGGGALTREKIVASMSDEFICICDSSKQVNILGKFPLPVEVIPLACGQVSRTLEALGGRIQVRASKQDPSQVFVTDNGGWILDISGLEIEDPELLEMQMNQIPGVICNGIFALIPANTLIVSQATEVKTIQF